MSLHSKIAILPSLLLDERSSCLSQMKPSVACISVHARILAAVCFGRNTMTGLQLALAMSRRH